MPNFAQEFPLLLFLPCFIFTAVALAVCCVHLTMLLDRRRASSLAATTSAMRHSIAAAAALIPRAMEPRLPAQPKQAAAELRLISTEF